MILLCNFWFCQLFVWYFLSDLLAFILKNVMKMWVQAEGITSLSSSLTSYALVVSKSTAHRTCWRDIFMVWRVFHPPPRPYDCNQSTWSQTPGFSPSHSNPLSPQLRLSFASRLRLVCQKLVGCFFKVKVMTAFPSKEFLKQFLDKDFSWKVIFAP